MLRANLLLFTLGISIGWLLHYFALSSANEDMKMISLSLDSKLNGISERLSESRHSRQDITSTTNLEVSEKCLKSERLLDNLKQSIQWTMETTVRSIFQEELDFVVSQLPMGNQARFEPERTVDLQLESENMAKADQILSMAIGNGVWTQQDADAFNDALINMSDGAQAEAHRQLSLAINNNNVEIGDDVSMM
jgi:hypothetical protein